jgi:hypothetical protein
VEYSDVREMTNDHGIGRWAKGRAIQIFYPIPSLTSHRDDIESIHKRVIGQPQPERKRQALEFYE